MAPTSAAGSVAPVVPTRAAGSVAGRQPGAWRPRNWPPDAITGQFAIPVAGKPPIPRRAQSTWRRPPLRLPRRVLAMALVTPVVLGAVAVTLLWWHDTPPTAVHTRSDLLVAGGRVSGLLGAYLLLLQVTLMARIPWLERHIGFDWLVVAHRWVGTYLVAMLAAHALLLTGGLALLDHTTFGRETVVVVLSYPGVLMAAAALLLLIAVGALSARVARKRLPYERWHAAHALAYLAIALGFSHQLLVGVDFEPHAARVAWTAAHLAVLACVLRFRIGQPLLSSWRHRLQVHSVVPEADGVISIHVTGRHLARMGAQPGQFFRWRFLTRDTWRQAHPFSLSAVPSRRMLRLTVKVRGDHTRALQRLRPGVRVIAEGPYGALTDVQRTQRRVLLIGGGIGVTPLRALLEGLQGEPGDISFLFRGDLPSALLFAKEFEALATKRGAAVHYLLGPRAKCCPRHDALSPRRLRALVPDVASRDVYVCGPPGMIEVARWALRQSGVPRRRIHTERFDL